MKKDNVAVRWMFAFHASYGEIAFVTCESRREAKSERDYRRDVLLRPVGPIVRVEVPLPEEARALEGGKP